MDDKYESIFAFVETRAAELVQDIEDFRIMTKNLIHEAKNDQIIKILNNMEQRIKNIEDKMTPEEVAD